MLHEFAHKLDMLDADQRVKAVKDFLKRSRFKGPVFEISALTREGCEPLIRAIYPFIEQVRLAQQAPVQLDPRFAQAADTPS